MHERVYNEIKETEPQGHLRVATALSAAASLDEVAAVVDRSAGASVAATFANLAVFDRATNRVRVIHAASLPTDIAQRWEEFPVDTATPLCAAILTGQPVLLPDMEAIRREYALLVDDTVAAGLQATASLPLRAPDGSSIGAIGLAWPEPQEFDPLQMSELEVLAELVARTALRVGDRPRTAAGPNGSSAQTDPNWPASHAQQTDSGLEAVHVLQEVLLARRFIHGPDLEVAAAYLPASDAPMGGDWYDLFAIGEATCLVVGDVAGHGIEATAAMAELKHAVRAYAAEDPTPSTIASRINRLVHRLHPGLTATLVVATWQPHTRTLWRCNAGHPPLLQCRAGEYEYVSLAYGPNAMVGVDPDHEYHQESQEVRPGTTLVFYSDGLVEQPPEAIDQTMERLLRYCADEGTLSPHRLVNDVLLWRLRQGPARDDICLMAVQFS